jgi:hypothetical protein
MKQSRLGVYGRWLGDAAKAPTPVHAGPVLVRSCEERVRDETVVVGRRIGDKSRLRVWTTLIRGGCVPDRNAPDGSGQTSIPAATRATPRHTGTLASFGTSAQSVLDT